MWLASLGKERIDEVFDPEIAVKRAVEYYRKREKMIMDMEYSIITNYIKLRKNAKISQEQLANETNVIRTTIARIENNMNSPQLKTML
jgi:DNA-binding XRE family transcriptional regulator